MPPSHPLIFSFDPPEWLIIEISCGELSGDLKTNREESLTKHAGFVHASAKKGKNRKINDEKGVDKQKNQES